MNEVEAAGLKPARWARRATVLVLVGLAAFLVLGPQLEVLTTFVVPVAGLMVLRSMQRRSEERLALRTGSATPQPMSKRAYAIVATLLTAIISLPLWLLCEKALIALTLLPSLVCVWFAVYLLRGSS